MGIQRERCGGGSGIKVTGTPKPDPSEMVPRDTVFRLRVAAACPDPGGRRSRQAGGPEVGP
jgi:hypothetical protein